MSEHDDREQALPDIFGVQVIGKSLELGNDEYVEYAQPDSEYRPQNSRRCTGGVQYIKKNQVGNKKKRHRCDEFMAWDFGRRVAENLYDENKQKSHGRKKIGFLFRSVVREK